MIDGKVTKVAMNAKRFSYANILQALTTELKLERVEKGGSIGGDSEERWVLCCGSHNLQTNNIYIWL